MQPVILQLLLVARSVAAAEDEATPIFRTDVSMGRIDTLVVDRSQQPIGGLRKEDFSLHQGEELIPVRDLAYEDLPVDVLLLLDVSRSMLPHVQAVASAAHRALAILGDQDQVGIMVFDTRTRLRLPYRQNLAEVEFRLDDVVRSEQFNGGTNICDALLNAADYVEREGRRQTRHAIVIVTDDEAAPCNQAWISASLDRADVVLMALLATTLPDPPAGWRGWPGRNPPVTVPWRGRIGSIGGPIQGRRGNQRLPNSPRVVFGNQNRISAGSPEIARASGGEALNVNDAGAVETTFERIRRRYAIYFYAPNGMDLGRGLELDLTEMARRRHPDAVLKYRQVALGLERTEPGQISRVPAYPPSRDNPKPVR